MPLPVIIILVVIVGPLVFFVFRLVRGGKGAGVQFYAQGKDAGFSFKEIDLLRKLAVKSNLGDPSSLFWSQNQLDICIRSLVRNSQISGDDQNQETQNFLSKLYDFRKKIEMEKYRMKNGISSSRQIDELQYLRINVKDLGTFKAKVLANNSQFLTISRPEGDKVLPPNFAWNKQRLSVYFWRQDDAGYIFESDVKEEFKSKGAAALKLTHSESLSRTQKRKSLRVKLQKPAFLYPFTGEAQEDVGKLEETPGLKCLMEDLSETGLAVTIGGKGTTGIRVKVQFSLNNAPVSISGTVRSLEYKGPELNRSLLHIEADPLPLDTRNRVLGEVFGMSSDDEEFLPYLSSDQSNSDDGAIN
ncbi:pilus assembly protein PilZ [Spirochaetia bacterium]|nr:pilus assembly protein PilZ [Spirochaetia bacterium]